MTKINKKQWRYLPWIQIWKTQFGEIFPCTSVAEYTILWTPTGKKELGCGPLTWVRVADLELSVAWGISQEMLTGWPFLSAYLKMSSGQFCISGLCVSKWFYTPISIVEI